MSLATQHLQTGGRRTEGTLSRDTIFATLSNERRRFVLHYLKRADGPVCIRDLAEQVAAWETGTPIEALTYKQRKRVYTSLHQTHLPKLADAGVIESERSWEEITLTEQADQLQFYLEVVSEDELPWSDFYLGLSLLAALAVGGAWLGVPPLSALPGLGWAALFCGVLLVVAGVHALDARRSLLGGDDDAPAGAERELE
jgi:DNA-binding transcriptional ArsR family regulator